MNLIEETVKQANTVYSTGAKMMPCNIGDEIASQHIELWDIIEIIDALHKKVWTVYEDQYPEVLESLAECREIINEADRTADRDIDPMDLSRDLEHQIGKAEYEEDR